MAGITRNVVYRGPGTNNWDMTLAKNIPITERIHFQLRGEAYNIFNHVSFNAVNNTATFNATTGALTTNGNFGALVGDRGARILQLVGKISF
jgi:PPE-repeat protein